MKVFHANCEQFDNHATGFYSTPEQAEAAFWAENEFTKLERQRVRVYTCVQDDCDELREIAAYRAKNGSPSPAFA